jgi:hypothetical protein
MPLFKRTETPPLIRIQAATATEICREFELDPAAKALLVPGQNPTDFLQALEKNRLSGEAVKLIAYGLPEREAVWWLCQSSRVVDANLNQAERGALAAAEKWVKDPSPANKEAAGETAAKTDKTGPGGWAAQAAAWSTHPAPYVPKGTIPLTPAEPTDGLTAPAVAGGILLAAGLVGKPAMPEVKILELNAPVVAAPNVPAVNVALPGAPGAPAISVAKPAMPGLTVPQPGMPGMPAVTVPQAPGLSVPSPAVPSVQLPVVQLPDGIEALQVPGVPLLEKQELKMAAPAPLGLPSVPEITAPEIPPVDQKKLAKMLKPFLELGREVAGGKNLWTSAEAE